ncbi:glycoside hydrolase family 76 protein [Cohnella hongkongensis]|uniref:Glycoside hydrolase family 76 protein n=1 Tax=Cohnella hongkongensis TaxID=178337 RepID=A0ABV9F4T9_9BACL
MIDIGTKRIVWMGGAALGLALASAILLWIAPGWTGETKREVWGARADEAGAELDLSFWDGKRGMFNNASPCILQACTDPFNYWWQAHAADALLDRYERTGNEETKAQIGELFDGVRARNAGVWTNGYYDDMEWMALAWLRAYELLGEDRYKEAALELWADIRTGWNEEMGGGIAWRKEQLDYKNTPANAPAVILAARLYRNFGSQDDLQWALNLYDWQKRTLVDPVSGLVWDGINRTGDGQIDKDWKFTYGQGVFIGAAMELYEQTGEEKYREDANRTADYVLSEMASPATGLLPNEGDGDGGLFKGVLVRYLTEWAARDAERGREYGSLILNNADSLWDYGRAGDAARFGTSWAQPPETVVQLSSQLSGVILVEQAARLESLGF